MNCVFLFHLQYIYFRDSVTMFVCVSSGLRPVNSDLCLGVSPNTTQLCHIPCPVECEVSSWSAWGPCTFENCQDQSTKKGKLELEDHFIIYSCVWGAVVSPISLKQSGSINVLFHCKSHELCTGSLSTHNSLHPTSHLYLRHQHPGHKLINAYWGRRFIFLKVYEPGAL